MTTRREFLVGMAALPLLGYTPKVPGGIDLQGTPLPMVNRVYPPIATYRIDVYDGRYIEIIDLGKDFLVNFNGKMSEVMDRGRWLLAGSAFCGFVWFKRSGSADAPAILIRDVVFFNPLLMSSPNWEIT